MNIKQFPYYLLLLFPISSSISIPNGYWEKIKKVSKNKEIFVDCPRFCHPANKYEMFNNCNGVFLRTWDKSNRQHPKHNNPLYFYDKKGGVCAQKKKWNFRQKIKFKQVEQLCNCRSTLPAKEIVQDINLIRACPHFPSLIQIKEKTILSTAL